MAANRIDPAFWAGRRVFLTGHTGFKGSWLGIWLDMLGAQTTGYALPPERAEDMFAHLQLERALAGSLDHRIGDIGDFEALQEALRAARPEIVIHMAAQPLVRRSYREPLATFATNVMGTAHLLEAARHVPGIQAILLVTTDKCYENLEHELPYKEGDHLGGHDPYSASKAGSEIVGAAYRRSFLAEQGVMVATARAGNVIGGGDWSEDRLIPDAVRAWRDGETLVIRSPSATRPWQHVIEPLRGYLMLAEALCGAGGAAAAEAWNFGPRLDAVQPVRHVIEKMADRWDAMAAEMRRQGGEARWRAENELPALHEAQRLQLDCTKAADKLGWTPRLSLDQALDLTTDWYLRAAQETAGDALLALTRAQISNNS